MLPTCWDSCSVTNLLGQLYCYLPVGTVVELQVRPARVHKVRPQSPDHRLEAHGDEQCEGSTVQEHGDQLQGRDQELLDAPRALPTLDEFTVQLQQNDLQQENRMAFSTTVILNYVRFC